MSYSKSSDSKFKPVLLYNDPKEIVPFSSVVVPSSMRSNLWKYFGFPADKNQVIITKNRIVCCICHVYIAYNKNTTNLSTHLKCKHPAIWSQIKGAKRGQVEFEELRPINQGKVESLEFSPKRSKLTEQDDQVSWCTESLESRVKEEIHPTGITRKICARRNKSSVKYKHKSSQNNSQVVILNASPGKTIYENLVIESDGHETDDSENASQYIETIDYNNIEISEDGNEIITEVLEADISGASLSKNELATNEFATVDEHIGVLLESPAKEVEVPTQKMTNLLDDRHKDDNNHDSDEITEEIKKFLIKDIISPNIVNGSGFKDLIGFFTHVDVPNSIQIEESIEQEYNAQHSHVMTAIKSIISNRNYSLSFHKLNSSIVEISINYWPDVSNPNVPLENLIFCIAKKCTNFILSNTDSLKQCSAFVVDFDVDDDFQAVIPEDIPVIPTLSFVAKLAFDACMQISPVRSAIELADGALMGRIKKSHTWLQQFDYLSQFIGESTNAENNRIIQVLIKCFQPLKNCLDVLAFETSSYASIMRPVISQLISLHYTVNEIVIETDESDTVVLEKNIKETIYQVFEEKVISNKFLTVASFLDPRFQRMIEPEDLKLIRDELGKYAQSSEVKTTKVKAEEKTTKAKHEKSLPLLSLFSKVTPVTKKAAPKNRFDIDFRRYNEEACLEIQLCPLEWWFETESSYPTLKPLVRKYFCVPAFVSNFHRLPLSEQEELENKYYSIENNVNEKILWLHLNKLRQGLSES